MYERYHRARSKRCRFVPPDGPDHKGEKGEAEMRAVMDKVEYEQGIGTERQLILIDIENLTGTPSPTHGDLAFAELKLREVIRDFDGAQCVVASSHRAARTVAFYFPGARRRWRSGPDGADLALLDEMSDLRIMKRFGRLTLVSGDWIFAETVAALGAAGIETTVVSREHSLSRQLRMAARYVTTLPDSEPTFEEAS
jgi:hypothetical protein